MRFLRAAAPETFVVEKVDRRTFLKATGMTGAGFTLGIFRSIGGIGSIAGSVSGTAGCGHSAPATSPTSTSTASAGGEATATEPVAEYTELGTFVSVGDDGTALITVHRSEMGQGVRTSLAMLVAEELGVRFQDVRVVQADGDPKYGDQNTDGSSSVFLFFEPLRVAGAKAREMLIAAAAAQLQVDAAELSAADSEVVHESSGRRLAYAALVADAAKLPAPDNPSLRSSAEFRIVGKPQLGVDNRDIVMGKARYGIDATVPGMLHASIERCPSVGGTVERYNEQAALAIPGVRKVVAIDAGESALLVQNGVAVVADNTWAAIQGRAALQVSWKPGDTAETTEAYRARLSDAIRNDDIPVTREVGDVAAAEKAAKATHEAEYRGPHLAHASMEPPVALADVRDASAEIWGPIQDPKRAAESVAAALGIDAKAVKVHVTLLGGAFGRKSQPDFVVEAAKVSRAVGAPVKLTWTREDDIRHGFYRPENRQLLRASFDGSGKLTALRGRSLFPSLMKVFSGSSQKPIDIELAMGWSNWPFDLPNMRAEATGFDTSLRVGWWRSVCHTFHAFAMCSFIDELAAKAGADPIAYYKQLLGPPRKVNAGRDPIDTARLARVIDKVAQMGLWGKPLPKGEGLGFAAHWSFRSYVACVMHVAVDDNHKVSVRSVDYAVDCGRPVNPDGIEAQVEGGLAYGLTAALFSEINVKDGVVQEGNFDRYKMLRINRMPKVRVAIIESDEPPTGIGEPPLPPVAPALTNALFAATGVRVRELPIQRAGFR